MTKLTHEESIEIARQFHDAYERLAPHFGYETRADTKTFDPESKNGRLMVAVCGTIAEGLIEGAMKAAQARREP